jgi:hypothetical protein
MVRVCSDDYAEPVIVIAGVVAPPLSPAVVETLEKIRLLMELLADACLSIMAAKKLPFSLSRRRQVKHMLWPLKGTAQDVDHSILHAY